MCSFFPCKLTANKKNHYRCTYTVPAVKKRKHDEKPISRNLSDDFGPGRVFLKQEEIKSGFGFRVLIFHIYFKVRCVGMQWEFIHMRRIKAFAGK